MAFGGDNFPLRTGSFGHMFVWRVLGETVSVGSEDSLPLTVDHPLEVPLNLNIDEPAAN